MAAIHQQHAQIARGDETIRYRWSLNGSASDRDVSDKDGSIPATRSGASRAADRSGCISRETSQGGMD